MTTIQELRIERNLRKAKNRKSNIKNERLFRKIWSEARMQIMGFQSFESDIIDVIMEYPPKKGIIVKKSCKYIDTARRLCVREIMKRMS